MTKDQIKEKIAEMEKAINDLAAQYNALMGAKGAYVSILAEMEKLEAEPPVAG